MSLTVQQVALGTMKKSDRRRVIRELTREANRGAPKRPASMDRLRAAGINVVREGRAS